MIRNLLFLSLLTACAGTDSGSDKPARDSNILGDSDTDTDADSDTDSGGGDAYPTYASFISAQAKAYCHMLSTCSLLDDAGFADIDQCATAISAKLQREACEAYDPVVAERCIGTERDAEKDCATAPVQPPPVCRTVCGP